MSNFRHQGIYRINDRLVYQYTFFLISKIWSDKLFFGKSPLDTKISKYSWNLILSFIFNKLIEIFVSPVMMQFLFSLPKRSIIGRNSALNCCMTSLLSFFFGGLYMLPKVMSCWRCSCWTLTKSPSHKSDAIIKSLKLYEYSSSKYVINPPWALQDFPLCIDLYPGISYCDVSLLSDSHVSCRHMALKWISFSLKYDRKPNLEKNQI